MNQQELKRNLLYNPETGVFKWVINKSRKTRAGSLAGTVNKTGHLVICIDGKKTLAHRLAWLYMTGYMPDGVIDHVDNNPGNNKWSNLRSTTQGKNCLNQKKRINNKSGVKGVSWVKSSGKWLARLRVNGEVMHVGLFGDLIGAEIAVKNARDKHHGEFANHG